MTTTLPATLADYSDATLRDFYGASTDEAWQAQILAEMARREVQDAAAKRRQAAHAQYRTTGEASDWYEMAHAQYLAAEERVRWASCSAMRAWPRRMPADDAMDRHRAMGAPDGIRGAPQLVGRQ